MLPYILNRGISKIDYMMISHFDADHCNGLIAILENIKVENLIISKQASICKEYENIMKIVKKKKIAVKVVEKGDKVIVDKLVYLDILHPDKQLTNDNKGGLNVNSIVAKVYYKQKNNRNFRILFTGDIEEDAENIIIKKEDINLEAEILKIAHHGSKTSSTDGFLEKVKPRIALIGVGEKNTFGHPNDIVLKRLLSRGVKIYRTDLHGEIRLKMNRKGKVFVDTMIK